LYRRIPKLKHFTVINPKRFTVINVEALSNLAPNSTVTVESLLEAGILTTARDPLKVLGNGALTVPLTVQAAAFTSGARAKIEAAGGTCEVV
jgi:large subunit ribosomal protein L15